MDLEVDQEQNERGRSLEESDSKIKEVVQSIVSSGKVGSLTLDPSYLIFQPVQSKNISAEEQHLIFFIFLCINQLLFSYIGSFFFFWSILW